MFAEDWADKLSPVVLVLFAAIHEKLDETFEFKLRPTEVPVQIVAVEVLVILGVELTVTETVCETPRHELAVVVGVTVYVTVVGARLLFKVSTSEMEDPD